MAASVVEAAKALLLSIQAPQGVVTVLPVTDKAGERLIVQVDAKYMQKVRFLSDTFDGYPVAIAEKASRLRV